MSGIPAGATFVFFDGCRFTPSMLADFKRMDAAFYAEFKLHLVASSAIRFESEQETIFRERYVPATQVAGRRVYDFRWWKGILWARISAAGTVAAPDSPQANHVVENTGSGAVDIRDSGTDPGVMTAGTIRANWLRANAHRFNFLPEGYTFGEPWHYKYVGNLWAAVASVGPVTKPTHPSNTPNPQEDDMFTDDDRAKLNALWNDRAPSGGIQVYQRDEGTLEWMLVDPTLPALDAKQDGYRITQDPEVERVWARQYSGADKVPVHVNRDDYIKAQEFARARAKQYRDGMTAIVKAALSSAPAAR